MIKSSLFYVLLALRAKDRHGYEILKEVQAGSLGTIRLGPATLYTSLKKLVDTGLVHEVAGPRDGDPRRRYYRLTSAGRKALAEELDQMERALVHAGRTPARATP